ncbi:zinc-binding dehydrogenase [Nonomuraea angiospora]|uniref:Peptidase S9 prolyl oligopeptidase catalytic domain-containing protein n=1 Tax=Nonomuraea angiospora TaxID=46172 RepID=A0ABR9MHC7_9ACTN|nr:zinc-binding dehydrogenase [Nonomuraea angiospora]MBE1592297.1 hypothetical protein [Nonomuraea angiospora]
MAPHTAEIAVLNLARHEFRYLTDTRPPALHVIDPVAPELITYPARDGRDVHALLYRPDGPGPHPVLLSIHGGPESQERPLYARSGLYQHLLHQGIAILALNFAGSTGYGAAHQKLIYCDWGGIDLDDLDHAVQYLHALDWTDPNRLSHATTDPATLRAAGYDAVFDTFGAFVIDAVADGGRYASIATQAGPVPDLSHRRVKTTVSQVREDGRGLAGLAAAIDGGRLKIRLGAQYPVHNAKAAHEHFQRGRLTGKIALIF